MKNMMRAWSMILVAMSFTWQPFAFAGENQLSHGWAGAVARALPDLRVRGVKMGDPATGEFSVIIQNIGKGNASNCQLRLWVLGEGGKTYALVEVNQPPINAGAFTIVKISADRGLLAYQRYEITTDSSNKVAESNEGNNTWQGKTGKV